MFLSSLVRIYTKEESTMEISERIKLCRENANITQSKLAELIHVSPSFMNRIEKGSCTPSLECVCSIAEALNITPQDLLCDIFVYDTNTLSTSEKIAATVEKFSPAMQSIILETLEYLSSRLN